jgi:hypothetical protein
MVEAVWAKTKPAQGINPDVRYGTIEATER